MTVPGTPDPDAVSHAESVAAQPEQVLVLGYNKSLHTMLAELNDYVAAGSSVTVVADMADPTFSLYQNMTVELHER